MAGIFFTVIAPSSLQDYFKLYDILLLIIYRRRESSDRAVNKEKRWGYRKKELSQMPQVELAFE
jgi:hypothetical protein